MVIDMDQHLGKWHAMELQVLFVDLSNWSKDQCCSCTGKVWGRLPAETLLVSRDVVYVLVGSIIFFQDRKEKEKEKKRVCGETMKE